MFILLDYAKCILTSKIIWRLLLLFRGLIYFSRASFERCQLNRPSNLRSSFCSCSMKMPGVGHPGAVQGFTAADPRAAVHTCTWTSRNQGRGCGKPELLGWGGQFQPESPQRSRTPFLGWKGPETHGTPKTTGDQKLRGLPSK